MIIINGTVAETTTQQYYQSKLTKFINALFSGEPYQLGYTTFVTVSRIEEQGENTQNQAWDITLYGNMQNIFAIGDSVTVTAQRVGNRLIAHRIFNHSINSNVYVQPLIPAWIIRLFALLLCAIVIWIIHIFASVDYATVGNSMGKTLTSAIYSALPTVIGVWITWILIKSFFKHKR